LMRRGLVTAALAVGVTLAAPAGAATLRAVRHIISPGITRLIVEFSAPVRYRLQLVPAAPQLGVPRRLYLDLTDTDLAQTVPQAVDLREGPLLRLRAGARAGHLTRLILDVPGLSQYAAFAMYDPFRLIVDVRGTPRGAPAGAVPSLTRQAAAPHGVSPRGAPRRLLTVVLDPGHGGKDPGAIGVGGLAEKDVVLAIARRLQTRLQALPGVRVVLTRAADVFVPLEERTARANAERADLFVSIHANASPNPRLAGVETYYLNNTDDRATLRLAAMENGLRTVTGHRIGSRDVSLILSDLIQSYKVEESAHLADDVQHALVGALAARGGGNDLGVKRGPFYVLVGAGMPCVLVEVSFLTNPKEGPRLAAPAYQTAIADGLLRGIERFVNNRRVAGNL
jgi:N-acetylmuramoyl-L-alanine amidase